MYNLLLSVDEHKYVSRHKTHLETRFGVMIIISEVEKNGPSCVSNVRFASILGGNQNINRLKTFLGTQIEELKVKQEKRYTVQNNVPLITLSDSDSGSPVSILVDIQNKAKNNKKNKRKRSEQPADLSPSVIILNEICEVPSSTDPKSKRLRIDTPLWPGDRFIPLSVAKNKDGISNALDVSVSTLDDNIVVTEERVPRPKQPRVLRPIVIDGSNIARAHGQTANTYSCKGIQIAIDYFLERGHTWVTAFVPRSRQYWTSGENPTTDVPILEKLEKTQLVCFTPSWKNGREWVNCYDDGFIIDLASKIDGVILSNDNYRDLIQKKPSLKNRIRNRLLKFCFVRDILLIPDDPLGRYGPCLDDYLSFPGT